MADAPPGECQALAPIQETLRTREQNRQYEEVLSVAASQESRLLQHGALRKAPGYDLSDPWLVSGEFDRAAGGGSWIKEHNAQLCKLIPGTPCRLKGVGETVGFLGPDLGEDGKTKGQFKVRFRNGKEAVHPGSLLLPMPTRPARQGDYAFAIDLRGALTHLNGRQGFCGMPPPREAALWVMFASPDETCPPEMHLLKPANLAALPLPSQGAARTPWEARMAALPTIAGISALADESLQEKRLMLLDDGVDGGGDDDDDDNDDDDDGSVDLGSEDEDDEEEDDENGQASSSSSSLEVGDVVRCQQTAKDTRRAGCIQQVGVDGDATKVEVLLFGQGQGQGPLDSSKSIQLDRAAVKKISQMELMEVAGSCSSCHELEPEEELLLCENFGKSCAGTWHLKCLTPPLKQVPSGDWFCPACSKPASNGPAAPNAKTKAKAKGQAGDTATPKKSAGKAKATPAASKAKSKAGPPAKKAKTSK
mmetsp:Transcript_22725/g.49983  ORF Transcript_22725/g.49983 Transcript_22725/m.49983 type:complete len:478 (-) Transcript_22725:295-1728(-)